MIQTCRTPPRREVPVWFVGCGDTSYHSTVVCYSSFESNVALEGLLLTLFKL